MNADQFNALYPIGTPVFAYPGSRPEDDSSARRIVTRTRTKAQTSASGHPVVWVEGEGAYLRLTHVDPVSESVWQAAQEAETAAAVAEQGALPVPVGETAEDPADRRRRIYIDGKGNGWIDLAVDLTTGERDLVGITDAWKIAPASEVRASTGDLREIGRCW
ncbi:hypothetical protein ACWERY_02425 [Streptomyces sp. NPDC004082]